MAEHASLFKFWFTRKQRENKPEDRPSTSTQVQPSATPEGTKRAPSQAQVIGSAKKVKKDGPRFVRVLTLQKWQKQTEDDDPGFKSKRPDLTWIRYESAGNVVSKVWCLFCRRKPRSFANSTRQLELRKMLTPMLTELIISRRQIANVMLNPKVMKMQKVCWRLYTLNINKTKWYDNKVEQQKKTQFSLNDYRYLKIITLLYSIENVKDAI